MAASWLSWSCKAPSHSSHCPSSISFPHAKLKPSVKACPLFSVVAPRLLWRAEAISLCNGSSKSLDDGHCKGAPHHTVSSSINIIISDGASGNAEARPTLREFCKGMLPEAFLHRAEEMGFVYPTDVQLQALPTLFSGQDCILHSQTGSGKTMCYLFSIFAKINSTRAAVQAVVLVPTRELGMQVVREARRLGKMHVMEDGSTQTPRERKGTLSVMTLLDGGSLSRQKSWLKADPPQMVVGTLQCVCKMIETKNLRTHAINTLIIDEVDAMFGQREHVALLRTLLTKYTLAQNRQTIFASATIAQYTQFIDKCVSEKWVKEKMVYVQANPGNKMPSYISHHHVVCGKDDKLAMLEAILCADKPKAAIIFVNEQSEASKRKGELPTTGIVMDFLSSAAVRSSEEESLWLQPLVLEENANIHVRTASLMGFPNDKRLLVATDLAARGLDIPEISHVYNFELPPSATAYIHRGGRTARKPLTYDEGIVTSFVSKQELFVFERYQNEVMFVSEEKSATW